ncbi:MAG: hypothetical protein IKA31_05525 [Clostridia bacterium]|nr:hypothetical protein [Clostridia bacterium]
MIEYQSLVLQNNQFKNLCNQELNCNSFLIESNDEVFLTNFSYCFAQHIFCTNNQKKPCNMCISCQKVSLLKHSDLKIYPKNQKNILVDDVKDLIENVNLTPVESEHKVFIFNNFSTANTQSQNKLLKILEEPPKNTYIILNVTNINKVLPTVVSRCKKIRLSPLSKQEIENFVNLDFLPDDNKKNILDVSQGSLTKVLNYSNNENFNQAFVGCLKSLTEMRDSKQLIKYSSLIGKSKQVFEIALEIFESIFRDCLMIRLNKQNLVINNNIVDKLLLISQTLDADSLDLIIKKIYAIKKQLEFNCNYVLLVDNLLLYILEVKFLCNKK